MTCLTPSLLLIFVAAGLAPSLGVAEQAATGVPDPTLLSVQQAADAGRLAEAESAARAYLKSHVDSADGHYLLGYILFKEDKAKASLAEYAAAGTVRRPSALDLMAMGSDYFLLEDYAGADRTLSAALALDQQNPLTLYLLGRAKYNEQRFSEALPLFEKCLQLDSKNVLAADYLGLSYERLGRAAEATSAYRMAIAADGDPPRNASPRLNLGTLLAESGKAQEAVPLLASAVALMPDDAAAHREAGKAYLLTGQWQQARAELETALKLEPHNASSHFLLSEVYAKLGLPDQTRAETAIGQDSSPVDGLSEARALVEASKFREAEGLIRQYLEIHRASADGHYLLGYVLFKQREAKESLAEYTEGAQYRKPTAADLEAVGGDYVLLHDYPDADKWFSLAAEWEPGNFQVRYLLARAKYSENRFDEAVATFLECLKLDPRNVMAEDNLGLAFEGLDRNEEALAAYRQAISWQGSEGEDANPYIDLGALLVNLNRPAEATEPLLKAVELAPGEMRAHRELGKSYAHLGQLEKAQREFEKTVELAPDVASPHYLLAQTYRKLGLTGKAQAESDRYRELTKTHSSDNETGMAGRKPEER